MARVDLAATSTEYVRVPVQAREDGVAVNPTLTATTWLAFVPRDDADGGPVSGDWITAEWEADGATYYSRVMVGPAGGAITLTKGYYRIWVKLSVSPETPIKSVGTLYVF